MKGPIPSGWGKNAEGTHEHSRVVPEECHVYDDRQNDGNLHPAQLQY